MVRGRYDQAFASKSCVAFPGMLLNPVRREVGHIKAVATITP